MKIPKVKFRQADLSNDKIETIDLSSVFSRKEELEHDPLKPHRVSFYLLIYIEEGQGKHFIDFNEYEFHAGSFIFINKNQVHAFDLSQQPKGKMILFTSEFVDELQANMRIPMFAPTYLNTSYSPVFVADKALKKSSEALINEIQKEMDSEHDDSLISMYLFSALFMMLERAASNKNISAENDNKRFNQFVELLEGEFVLSRDASSYAEKMHITYKTLNQICKEVTQQTAKQLIDSYTVLESKRRLIIEAKPIQQLSFELGFEEPSNFVKYFKKHTELTPSQFRKQLKG